MANFDLLKAQIAARIHDNVAQEITAEDVRRSFNDTIDAINAAKEDEGAIAPAQWGGITGDLADQTDLKNALDAKQDTISNLATIEAGAAAGATAVQPGDLATVATSGSYSDLLNKPTIPAAPGTLDTTATTAQATSASEALSGSVVLHKISKTGDYGDLNNKPTIPAAQVNSDWNAGSGVAQILNKPTIPAAPGTLNTDNTGAQSVSSSEALSGTVKLHKISKTGSYADLNNKPTIPSISLNGSTNTTPSFYAPTGAGTLGQVLTSNGSGAPTWQAAPGGDVTDVTLGGTSVVDGNGVAVLPAYPVVPTLAAVATSGDYDDLLNKPTIPAAQVNADWSANSGVAQILNKPTIPTVPTISTDIETDKLYNDKTASPKAVYDFVGNPVESVTVPAPYDGTLVFTHRDGDTDTVDLNHSHPQYALKVEVESSQPVGGMAPNTLYNLGTISGAVTFSFAAPTDNTIMNEYMFTFDSGSTAAVPTWPNSITAWAGNCLDANNVPEIAASKHYEVSVLGAYGLIAEF